MRYNSAQPHIASYVWLERDGKVAFLLRTGTDWRNDHYGLPSGKVEPGESYTQAAVREAKEETGIDITATDLKQIFTMQRLHSPEDSKDNPEWVDVVFKALNWQGEPFNAEPHKHGELVWLDPTKLPANMVPYVRAVVEAIQAGQTYAEYGWER